MTLVLKTPSDVTAWFEQEPAPYWGERRTMLDDPRQVELTVHASELPMDYLLSLLHFEPADLESFDLCSFELTH